VASMRVAKRTTSFEKNLRSERGAILIHVGIALFALMGFTVFVLDYGVFWLGRRQAQNAADAGALAGAISRSFNETGLPISGGPTQTSATLIAQSNQIVGAAPGVVVSYGCPDFAPEATFGPCVRVDTFRDGTNSSTPLPTYFANLWGLTSQNVKATATAQVRAANYSDCLKPWMIPDKYHEVTPPSTQFNGADYYTAPGYTTADIGTVLTLKQGDPAGTISPSDYYEIGEANTYREAIRGCVIGGGIGDWMTSLPGNRVGPTQSATRDLINADSSANVNPVNLVAKTCNTVVRGSCAPNCTGYEGKPTSPRIVPVAMFSPAAFAAQDRTSGRFPIQIVNILAMFIIDVGPPQATVTGCIVGDVGLLKPGPTVGGGESFLHVVQLIR